MQGGTPKLRQVKHVEFRCKVEPPSSARFAEFGRAMARRNLTGNSQVVHYFGMILSEFDTNSADLKSLVYEHWDSNTSLSPPKTRPAREQAKQAPPPALDILAWSNALPCFPASLLSRFPEGSSEALKIAEFKAQFDAKFPQSNQPRPASGGGGRAGGVCDYTIDNNLEPLDHTRMIDLPPHVADTFSVTRLGPEKRMT